MLAALVASMLAFASAEAPPALSVRTFTGPVGNQRFADLSGQLTPTGRQGATVRWACDLRGADGKPAGIRFEAVSRPVGRRTTWSYRVANRARGVTVCRVAFPTVGPVRIGAGWASNRILWPSLYRGACITELATQAGFEKQAREACKDVPYLHGLYQGDLCLPYCVQEGPGGCFALSVMDPTHEVLTLDALRSEEGMTYTVTTNPNVPAGASWRFGEIVVDHTPQPWQAVADRYRAWLVRNKLDGLPNRHREPATLMYGRWDDLRTDEVLQWTSRFGIKDVLIWVNLYGRGDQYYPCYFPNPRTTGYEGMRHELARMNAAGLAPYFYTNGYLLSPLQTRADVLEWRAKHPDQYDAGAAEGDTGYAEEVARFRAEHDFAGDWLQRPGVILPLRVRRLDFTWGENPVYPWHGRPFYAACVADPRWRRLFRDTARMHAELGARGIYIDQPGAIHPEICAAQGHGHDGESFGMWNRAYLRLMAETRAAGNTIRPGFFMEIEGSSDLYGRSCERSLGRFGADGITGVQFPDMLRYTAPWIMTSFGIPDLANAEADTKVIEDTLEYGGSFMVATGGGEAPGTEAARLVTAAIRARRTLAPYFDQGAYGGTLGAANSGAIARRFAGRAGTLVTVRASRDGATASLPAPWVAGRLLEFDWRTGRSSVVASRTDRGRITITGLARGLHLLVAPAK